MTRLAPYVQSLARVVFGFLVFRHGLEQVVAYPEESDAPRASFEGAVELLALPGGVLLMLGLYTRPVCLVLAPLYFVLCWVGPFRESPYPHTNGADPILLNAFFFLYLATAGAGVWALDRARKPAAEAWQALTARAPQALGLLRIVAGILFFMHGVQKFWGVGGGLISRDITTLRGLAGLLETVGGPLVAFGLFTRPVAFLLSGEMAVAYFRTWAPRGFWESFAQPGMEASILFCFFFLFLWAKGPGAWSLDALVHRPK